jgi:hypothetical protein
MSAERKAELIHAVKECMDMAKPVRTLSGQKVFIIGVYVQEVKDFINWIIPHDESRGDHLSKYPVAETITPLKQALEGIL